MRTQQENFGTAIPAMMMPLLSTKAPESPNFINNITHNDDDSNITEVFTNFNLTHENKTTLPASTNKLYNGGYFACATMPGKYKAVSLLIQIQSCFSKINTQCIPLATSKPSPKLKHMPELPSSLLHTLSSLTTCQCTALTLSIMQCHQWGDIIIIQ